MNILLFLLFIVVLKILYDIFFKIENFATYSKKERKCIQIDNTKELEYLNKKFKPVNCSVNEFNYDTIEYKDVENLNNTSFVQQETLDAINQYPQTDIFIDSLMAGKFKPECCPSVYSNSHGCLCKGRSTFDLIVTRGGNRASIPIVHY